VWWPKRQKDDQSFVLHIWFNSQILAKSSKGGSPLFLLHLPGYGWWLLLAANKNSSKKPVLKAWILRYATTSFADDTRGGTMSTGAVISRKQKAAFQSECTSLLGHRACGQKSPDCLTATPRAPPPRTPACHSAPPLWWVPERRRVRTSFPAIVMRLSAPHSFPLYLCM
jgi:hypothetical protein